MIQVILRDQPTQAEDNQALSLFLSQQNILGEHFAVAINAQFIPRYCYDQTILKAQDVIDIILPMQGG